MEEKKQEKVIDLVPSYVSEATITWGEILKLAYNKSKKHLKYVIPGVIGLTWFFLRQRNEREDEEKLSREDVGSRLSREELSNVSDSEGSDQEHRDRLGSVPPPTESKERESF